MPKIVSQTNLQAKYQPSQPATPNLKTEIKLNLKSTRLVITLTPAGTTKYVHHRGLFSDHLHNNNASILLGELIILLAYLYP
jgi:hypothetical protein